MQRMEVIAILHGPEFGHVELAVRRKLDAQGVVDADVRDDGAKELRMLRERGAHEQAAPAK
jgi:hypothetical protein